MTHARVTARGVSCNRPPGARAHTRMCCAPRWLSSCISHPFWGAFQGSERGMARQARTGPNVPSNAPRMSTHTLRRQRPGIRRDASGHQDKGIPMDTAHVLCQCVTPLQSSTARGPARPPPPPAARPAASEEARRTQTICPGPCSKTRRGARATRARRRFALPFPSCRSLVPGASGEGWAGGGSPGPQWPSAFAASVFPGVAP